MIVLGSAGTSALHNVVSCVEKEVYKPRLRLALANDSPQAVFAWSWNARG